MAIKIDGKIVAGIGASGKSAYEHAKNGGYTGSETSFNQGLADINDYVTEDEMYTYVDETVGNIDFNNIP